MKEDGSNKLINIRPLCVAALCLIAGILCGYFTYVYGWWVNAIFVAVFLVAIIFVRFYKFKENRRALVLLLVALLIFTIGYLRTSISVINAKNAPSISGEVTLVGVIDDMSTSEGVQKITLNSCSVNGDKLNGKVVFYINTVSGLSDADLGYRILLNCNINKNDGKYNNAASFLGGIYYTAKSVTNISIINSEPNLLQFLFKEVRSFLRNNLSKEAFPYALALLLGDTSHMPSVSYANFQMAGIAHVFAVSGLHMGVFISIFSFLSKRIKANAVAKCIFILLPAFLYCGLCGFNSSTLRAFVMAAITLLATNTGFKRDGLSSVAVAAVGILLVKPMELFGVGFRLSFMAVIAIFTLAPVFNRGSRGVKFVGEPLSVSLSAQLGTMPILADMSGYTSIIAVFANLIFVPLMVFIYILTFVCTIFGLIESAIFQNASVSMFLPEVLINFASKTIGIVNFHAFTIPTHFHALRIVWYIGLAALSDTVNLTLKNKSVIVGLCLALCVIFGMIL